MLKPALPTGAGELDEAVLRSELRALRRQIPDQPFLNPIVKVAGDWLQEMRRIRNEADYNLRGWFDHRMAIDNVDKWPRTAGIEVTVPR